MKPVIVLFVSICLLSIYACNTNDQPKTPVLSNTTDTANYTRIAWQDSLVNFGSIHMGEQIKVVFKCRNTGSKPLYLSNVRAGCGCTVPDYTKGAIPPGGEGVVTGAFDSNKSHPGEVRKNIFVTTNTPNGINHTLTFAGTIQETAPAN